MLIRVCGGIACSSNGGGRNIASAIDRELSRHGVRTDDYEIVSAHCLGRCADGPCVRVNGKTYKQMHDSDIAEFVVTELLNLFK